ncbi:MAG: hypothetical protein O6940_02015, partial [Ignavibacteria bacterium]|nr:hypothetical protein [Ignavibacteria bacterium]
MDEEEKEITMLKKVIELPELDFRDKFVKWKAKESLEDLLIKTYFYSFLFLVARYCTIPPKTLTALKPFFTSKSVAVPDLLPLLQITAISLSLNSS